MLSFKHILGGVAWGCHRCVCVCVFILMCVFSYISFSLVSVTFDVVAAALILRCSLCPVTLHPLSASLTETQSELPSVGSFSCLNYLLFCCYLHYHLRLLFLTSLIYHIAFVPNHF